MKTLEQFKNETLGGSYGNPGSGSYVGECVSYVRQYMEQVLGIKTAVWGDAVDYWTNPEVLKHFDKVPVGQERDGDIPVWGDDPGTWTGKEGHIGVRYQGKLLNQNYNGSRIVTINDMFTPGLLGYLRRKGGVVMPSNEQIEATINYIHWAYFGKAPSKAVADSWRGLLKQDYVNGEQTIFADCDKHPDALKNNQNAKYEEVTVYRKVK